MILMDTSSIIEFLEETETGEKIKDIMKDEIAAVSTITINELLVTSEGKEREKIGNLLKSMHVFSFDEKSSYKSIEIEKKLRKEGKMINKLDIFIAATCLVNNLSILTADKDFKKIESLDILAL